ncbi:flavin-containing monooxygenase [Pseudonocardia bannensis]|uniref:NAD(P)/FAD-dependent oxidoreductase n=1 Tax=Pseudonocardia bannensis TaxID=630973 RepID=A0A848DGT4_9PSEU|nr:NAD(P)/FAD-dependent oxidoreductase [Pseudonocardia bannensis]NMH91744.1 NAD(P)/FAD-dependent oxidoreductase [Pseudonocardia bannensis]
MPITTPEPLPTATDEELRAALSAANIPTLLLVLAHLTGDDRWLQDPYRPTRTIALNDNDTGGLPEARQAEIRDAALDVLRELRDGRRTVPAPPSDDRIVAMLSVSLGEQVPEEYAEAMAEDGGFRTPAWLRTPPLGGDRPRVLVIGAGISGVCIGVALAHLGLPFTIVERNDAVGGTWLENDYPGAGVDTPSHLYSYSFAPRPDWSRYYAKQPEILGYVQDVAREAGLLPSIRFGTDVVSARWDEASSTWEVLTRHRDGAEQRHVVDVVISSVGQFNRPVVPDLPGLSSFPGPAFHTARWDHDVDLAGKRVGVIGTGASSVQVVPAIADVAGQVVVFQRSPQWVAPNANYLREMHDHTMLLMAQVPGYRTWYRLRLMWMIQDKLHPTLRKDPDWPHPERSINALNDKHRRFFTAYLDEQIAGAEELREAVLPDYPPYGKRILLDNDWFATIRRDDVSLVASGVREIDGSVVVTADGARYEVDVLVLATGFSSRRMLYPLDIRGRSGVPLREQWGDDDAWAHLGISIPDFPNLFLLYGPNTNLGHGGSSFFHAECQTGYITGLLRRMAEDGIAALEVRPEVCDAYNARVDAAHEQMIWTHPGMTTYYRNVAGRIVTTTPWRLIDYWAMTRTPDLADFRVTARAGAPVPRAG